MSGWLIILAMLGLATKGLLAQAPGDEDGICNSPLVDRRVYNANWRILLDSFGYRSLVEGSRAAWTREDVDGTGTCFEHGSGGLCRNGARVCDFEHGDQENWIYTQYIQFVDALEVKIQINYQFSECFTRAACTVYHLDVYRHFSNDPSAAPVRSNYDPLATLNLDRATPNQISVIYFVRPEDYSGFFLAIKDVGTCATISRVQVYYERCLGSRVHLLTYPDLSWPPSDSSLINVGYAECVDNAANTSSLAVSSHSDGSCDYGIDEVCQCLPGYEEDPPAPSLSPKTCQACQRGFYRAADSVGVVCLQCPEAHTRKSIPAAAVCPCEDGAFRAEGEGPDIACSVPPDAVPFLEIGVGIPGSTSLNVSWERPDVIGRPDFHYSVWISDPDIINTFSFVDNVTNDGDNVHYVISGLRPNTEYIVKVSVHNGVSELDAENNFLRTTTATGKTLEGVPGVPSGIQPLCTVIVWRAPFEPNGLITEYELEFSSSADPSDIHPIRELPDANFLVVPFDIYDLVRIRAYTAVGAGEWTPRKPIGCPPPPEPVICPTTEPMTCPETEPPPECPTVTCPTTETPTDCPTVTCPTTETPTDCPTVTCPTTETLTHCPTPPPTVSLSLQGVSYPNNSMIFFEDIGEANNALLCMTDREACCSGGDNIPGGWFFPDGTEARGGYLGGDIYRNRGPQIVRLNRRNGAQSPRGTYRCEIPDTSGRIQQLFVTLMESTVVTCPTTEPPPECPTVTCPETEPPPECPTVTCPPPPEPETCPPPVTCATPECPVVTCPEPDPCPPPPTSDCCNYQQCTFEYCNNITNRRSACIMSADGCDGSCQVSNCRTCLSEEYDSSVLDCDTCDVDDEDCLRNWGLCIRQALVGERFAQNADQFHCAPHPCNDDGN